MRTDILPEGGPEFEQFVQCVWQCVAELSQNQKIAFLASLDSDVAQLFSVYVPLEELKAELSVAVALASDDLDELLDRLPVPDKETANRLELTVQQVINLRTAAKRKTARHLRAFLSPDLESRTMAT